MNTPDRQKLPSWLARPIPQPGKRRAVTEALARRCLETVCTNACCPNQGECYASGTATFMILGNLCTRECGFCAVKHGTPAAVDPAEPASVAAAVAELGLDYAVVTSVTRDDLEDGGAAHFGATITAIRGLCPDCGVEVLTPDFRGSLRAAEAVVAAGPDVFNHNIETVPRLYESVRAGADFERSLALLAHVKTVDPAMRTKSGLMVGLGETRAEIEEVLQRLCEAGCDGVTIGQYLAPRGCYPVARYVHPDEFQILGHLARRLGFSMVTSGPLVRSSYRASELAKAGES